MQKPLLRGVSLAGGAILLILLTFLYFNTRSEQQRAAPAAHSGAPAMVGILSSTSKESDTGKREAAARKIRRARIDEFPQLPQGVADELRRRSCRIPQPTPDGPLRNVIQGEFFAKDQTGWAVLCSDGKSTTLLVFPNDSGESPEALDQTEDSWYVGQDQSGRVLYLKEINTVNRNYIVSCYRAYEGPEPPPIDHHGIDVAFCERASIILYRYEGKWLRLQGAD